jgi:hypothetical protein
MPGGGSCSGRVQNGVRKVWSQRYRGFLICWNFLNFLKFFSPDSNLAHQIYPKYNLCDQKKVIFKKNRK